jgi:anamorsin
MSPSFVTIDNTPDIDFASDFNPAPTKETKNGITPSTTTATTAATQNRTLLLAPPSIAAQGTSALPNFDRDTTDLQMLDRLYAGLVTLPAATYDLVLLLTGEDGTRHAEASQLLSRDIFASLVESMKAGASLRTQDGRFDPSESREAVLAGLVEKNGGYEKVEEEEVVVPLRFGKKKNKTPVDGSNGSGDVHSSAGPAVDKVTIDVAGKPETLNMVPPTVKPVAGVGFDFGDDLDDDDELIDEDELMTEEDLNRPVQMRMSPLPSNTSDTHTCASFVPHADSAV